MFRKPDLIVMLTYNDLTVGDALSIFRANKELDVKYWGFKEQGLPLDKMKTLTEEIRLSGKSPVLEVVEYTPEKCLEGAKIAVECGFDVLMGTVYSDEINELCQRNGIKYMPFVGKVSERPSVLEGTVEEMLDEARAYIKKGASGIDLLAYRYTGDCDGLVRRFTEGIDADVCVAGSVDSFQKLDTVKASSARSFTVGSAFFDRKFGSDFGEQVKAVLKYIEE